MLCNTMQAHMPFWTSTDLVRKPSDVGRFKIRKNTLFSKVYAAYASAKSIETDSVVLLYDERRLHGNDTPEALGMEDGE